MPQVKASRPGCGDWCRCRRPPAPADRGRYRDRRIAPDGAMFSAKPKWHVKWKVLPCPSSLSTQICPPISSTSREEMASPVRCRRIARVVDVSACVKASKIDVLLLGRNADSRVADRKCSTIAVAILATRACASTTISPCSVNFMALPTRLIRICRSRSGSPISVRALGRDVARPVPGPSGARETRGPSACRRCCRAGRSRRFEIELARFDLREIENVVDDRQQRIGRRLDHARGTRAARR